MEATNRLYARVILSCILLLAFITISYKQFEKLLEEGTSISFNYMKEEIQLPAFAICQFHDSDLTEQSNMNFQEFMKDTFSIKDFIVNGYFEYGTTLPDEKFFPKKTFKVLDELANDGVWRESYYVRTERFVRLERCGILFPKSQAFLKPKTFAIIEIQLNMSLVDYYLIDVHELFQTMMNQEYSYGMLRELQPRKFIQYHYKPVINAKVKTKNHQCNEKNSNKLNLCFDKFYMAKLNCSFPWLMHYNGTLEKCGSKQYIKDFIKLITSVAHSTDTDIINDLRHHGCDVPNCKTTEWKMTSSESYDYDRGSNDSIVKFYFEYSSKIEVQKEAFIYGYKDLFADFGGYLGLLLGVSMLSVYDCTLEFFTKIFQVLKAKSTR